jgi:hypothetical protein
LIRFEYPFYLEMGNLTAARSLKFWSFNLRRGFYVVFGSQRKYRLFAVLIWICMKFSGISWKFIEKTMKKRNWLDWMDHDRCYQNARTIFGAYLSPAAKWTTLSWRFMYDTKTYKNGMNSWKI